MVMKADIEKMLYTAADSSKLCGINDALSFLVGSVRNRYAAGGCALSDDDLEKVAGGVHVPADADTVKKE